MSIARAPLGRIVIVGDGQIGVLAAIALKRASPASELLVIGMPVNPSAFADHIGTALPFSNALHDRLGIGEDDLIRRAGASHRLAMRYHGWSGEGSVGVAAYGMGVDPRLNSAFAREWGGGTRSADTGGQPGSIGQLLAESGRFAPLAQDGNSPLAGIDYGLRWNAPAYRDMLIEMATGMGIQYHPGPLVTVTPKADGEAGLDAIGVAGAPAITADLFIDASGPAAALLSGLAQTVWQPWQDHLPARQLVVGRTGPAALKLMDEIRWTQAGWQWNIAGRDGLTRFLAAHDWASEADIRAAFGEDPAGSVPIHARAAQQPWLGNVIALGDAALSCEPLGGIAVDLAHRQIELLVELLPGGDMHALEQAEYNRRVGQMAASARDWIASHYAAPAAGEVFARMQQSSQLSRLLDQFTRRQRFPHVDEAPMASSEWSAMLNALGTPTKLSALAFADGDGAVRHAQQIFRQKADAALNEAPPYGAWIQHVLQNQSE